MTAFFAIIARAPSDSTQPAYYQLPYVDNGAQLLGPARWMQRPDTALPEVGDACLVVEDSEGDPWIAVWWPKTFGPPAGGGGGTMVHAELDGLDADDHPHYLTAARGDARYPLLAHTHAIGDVTGLQTALDGKAATSHTHAIADTAGLQTALDAANTAITNHVADTGDVHQVIVRQATPPADTSVLWIDTDDAGASAIPVTIFDAKGDLIVGSSADGYTRVPVGANGSVLTSDTSQPGGVTWRNPFSELCQVVHRAGTTGTGTSTTSQIIVGSTSFNYNAAGAQGGLFSFNPADYDAGGSPYKVQVRIVGAFIGASSNSNANWLFELYRVTSFSGGVISGTTSAIVSVSTGTNVNANGLYEVASSWTDISTSGAHFLSHRPSVAAAAAVYATCRLEVRQIPA